LTRVIEKNRETYSATLIGGRFVFGLIWSRNRTPSGITEGLPEKKIFCFW